MVSKISPPPRRGPTAPTRNGKPAKLGDLFSRFSRKVSELAAHPATFVAAVVSVIVWAACGPASHFSENWQLWINTSTTILTFLMVFVLQNAQTRDTRALHLKLDELLRAVAGARNELIDLENLPEAELERYCSEFKRLHQTYARAIARSRARRKNTAANARES